MPEEAPVRVLVVSEDPAVIDDVRFGFPSDTEIQTAEDARAARSILEQGAPSVVVADLSSGNAGGYVLAREMSQMSALRDVPILILLEREQDKWLAKQAGADLIRTKPVTSEALAADALSLIH